MDRRQAEALLGGIYAAITKLRVPAEAGRPSKGE